MMLKFTALAKPLHLVIDTGMIDNDRFGQYLLSVADDGPDMAPGQCGMVLSQ